MNILIPCPHCGPRPVQEFIHGEVPGRAGLDHR
jgi:sarcosine oxidase delta subunit